MNVWAESWHDQHSIDWWTSSGPNGDFTWWNAPADAVTIGFQKPGYAKTMQALTPGQPNLIKLVPKD